MARRWLATPGGGSGPWPGSSPRISISPLMDIGFWKTSPGGWTVTLWTWGRRFRCRYAAETESSTGEPPSLPAITTFTWRKRAAWLVMGSPSLRAYGADQSDQVLSGVPVFPLRVWTCTSAPAGSDASQARRPQLETVSVSLTFEVNVPRAPAPPSSKTLPGFDV